MVASSHPIINGNDEQNKRQTQLYNIRQLESLKIPQTGSYCTACPQGPKPKQLQTKDPKTSKILKHLNLPIIHVKRTTISDCL